MLKGKPYISYALYISRIRDGQARKVWEINHIVEMDLRMEAMREFIYMGKEVWTVQGFFCEYVSSLPFYR